MFGSQDSCRHNDKSIPYHLIIFAKMFSYIIRNVNVDELSSTGVSDKFYHIMKLGQQLNLEYEGAKNKSDKVKIEIAQKEEQMYKIERVRVKLMSDLAFQMQSKHDLIKRVENLNNILQSTKFDLKKYSKAKISSVDLETLHHLKKTFLTYKTMMRIYFDYSNGLDTKIQKGYMCNIITKQMCYFEYNTDKITADEISKSLWNKLKKISSTIAI